MRHEPLNNLNINLKRIYLKLILVNAAMESNPEFDKNKISRDIYRYVESLSVDEVEGLIHFLSSFKHSDDKHRN